jgi:Family of unknown function (DUF6445)
MRLLAMPFDVAVNEHLSVQTHYAGNERQPVLIVDDYLRDPDSLVRYAVTETRFQPSPALYPGIVAPIADAYCESILDVLGPKIGETFAVKVETAYLTNCFFAILTFPPTQLHYRQLLPHVDDYGPGVIAVLHYLCAGAQGGTALFRHRATGYESLTKEKNQHLQSLISQDIASLGPLPPQYMKGDNRLYEQTTCIQAKFNRLVVYRGSILHSMVVNDETKFDADPRVGRLTANTFLRFESA